MVNFKKIHLQICSLLYFMLLSVIASAQQLRYTNGNNSWNPDSLGNHRAVVEFTGTGAVAKVVICWRRRDENTADKRIIIQDAATGQKILNVKVLAINREEGTVVFDPVSGKGNYYIYYMPYKYEGPNTYYPKGVYYKPEQTAAEDWLNNLPSAVETNCVVKELQSINAFNSFYPMEVIATAAETKNIIDKNSEHSFIVFPENRINSIRMKNDLPQRWVIKGPQKTFTETALRGEYLAFQLGIFPLKDISNVSVHFSDLKSKSGNSISAKNMSCINTDGIKYDGSIYSNNVNVAKGKVQAMWCAIDVPQTALPGTYSSTVTVS